MDTEKQRQRRLDDTRLTESGNARSEQLNTRGAYRVANQQSLACLSGSERRRPGWFLDMKYQTCSCVAHFLFWWEGSIQMGYFSHQSDIPLLLLACSLLPWENVYKAMNLNSVIMHAQTHIHTLTYTNKQTHTYIPTLCFKTLFWSGKNQSKQTNKQTNKQIWSRPNLCVVPVGYYSSVSNY